MANDLSLLLRLPQVQEPVLGQAEEIRAQVKPSATRGIGLEAMARAHKIMVPRKAV